MAGSEYNQSDVVFKPFRRRIAVKNYLFRLVVNTDQFLWKYEMHKNNKNGIKETY